MAGVNPHGGIGFGVCQSPRIGTRCPFCPVDLCNTPTGCPWGFTPGKTHKINTPARACGACATMIGTVLKLPPFCPRVPPGAVLRVVCRQRAPGARVCPFCVLVVRVGVVCPHGQPVGAQQNGQRKTPRANMARGVVCSATRGGGV